MTDATEVAVVNWENSYECGAERLFAPITIRTDLILIAPVDNGSETGGSRTRC
jgi:hypothetical protein